MNNLTRNSVPMRVPREMVNEIYKIKLRIEKRSGFRPSDTDVMRNIVAKLKRKRNGRKKRK